MERHTDGQYDNDEFETYPDIYIYTDFLKWIVEIWKKKIKLWDGQMEGQFDWIDIMSIKREPITTYYRNYTNIW